MSISPISFPTVSGTDATSVINAASPTGTAAAAGLTGTTGATGTAGTSAASGTSGTDFGNLVLDGLDRLEGLQNTSSNLAVQAATGNLNAIHDYTVAATEASTATQLAVSLRNQAISSFNSIMNMQF